MSNLGPLGGRQRPMLPTPPQGMTIARYRTYLEAQRAVDFLSDHNFPVRAVTIVGTDLQVVERVTGRLTYGRVALAGGLSGAWFGLFVGLLLSLFAGGAGSGVFAAIVIGAGFGILFGVISYAATGGRRDFTSMSQIVAAEYRLLCLEPQARAAMEVLGRMPVIPNATPPSPPAPSASDPGTAPWSAPPPAPEGSSSSPAPGSWSGPVGNPQAAGPGQPGPEPAATPPGQVTGPTYGEMIEKQRRERADRELRERAERAERERAERERAERERAERERAEPTAADNPGDHPPLAPPG